MKYTCPKCFAKQVNGRRENCSIDQTEYINLDEHINLKGEKCLVHPYNIVTGARRPVIFLGELLN
jgi:hypothetical protein